MQAPEPHTSVPDLADRPALPPILDWIGLIPIEHGERDVPHNHPEHGYCLCGHPWYMLCPGWWDGGGLAGVIFSAPDPT